MIIDVNAYLGHYAFRRLRHNTAESLLKLMDARKIDRAVISSASAITYRNVQSGKMSCRGAVHRSPDRSWTAHLARSSGPLVTLRLGPDGPH